MGKGWREKRGKAPQISFCTSGNALSIQQYIVANNNNNNSKDGGGGDDDDDDDDNYDNYPRCHVQQGGTRTPTPGYVLYALLLADFETTKQPVDTKCEPLK